MPTMTTAGFIPPKEPPKNPPKKKKPKKRRGRKSRVSLVTVISLCILLLALAVSGMILYVYHVTAPYDQTFLPGTFVMGEPFGGINWEEGIRRLQEKTGSVIRDWHAEVIWGQETYTLNAEQISLAVDAEATLTPLWEYGRDGGRFARFLTMLSGNAGTLSAEPVYTYDGEAVSEFVRGLATLIDREPVDGTVRFTPGTSTPFSFTDEQVGYQLETGPVREALCAAAARCSSLSMKAEPEVKEPEVYRSVLENAIVLRAQLDLSLGTDRDAAANAVLAVSQLGGRTIAPGESLSFNAVVGRRTADAGYLTANEEAYGLSARGVGGGVCMAATLLYETALLADVPVTERHAALTPVSYAPAGREAAVSDTLDVVLHNPGDTPLYLLVRTYEAGQETFAHLEIIGEALATTVSVESTTEVIPAPAEPVYVLDREGTHAVYQDEQVERNAARDGSRVVTERVMTDALGRETAREVISEDVYEAIPQTFYVGANVR